MCPASCGLATVPVYPGALHSTYGLLRHPQVHRYLGQTPYSLVGVGYLLIITNNCLMDSYSARRAPYPNSPSLAPNLNVCSALADHIKLLSKSSRPRHSQSSEIRKGDPSKHKPGTWHSIADNAISGAKVLRTVLRTDHFVKSGGSRVIQQNHHALSDACSYS